MTAPPALSGAEWRKAAAQAKARRGRGPAPRPAAKVAIPAPAGGAALTATARCLRCDWTTGPGGPAAVDKAAEKHGKDSGHPTVTCAEIGDTK